jgi:hypothetical protein
MPFDPDRHHRRSIRLRGYDYAQAGAYFVTICTDNREMFFADAALRQIAEKCWLAIPVPLPPLPAQRRIVAYLDGLQAQVDELRRLQTATQKELDALMPSTRSVAKAFAGEL